MHILVFHHVFIQTKFHYYYSKKIQTPQNKKTSTDGAGQSTHEREQLFIGISLIGIWKSKSKFFYLQ